MWRSLQIDFSFFLHHYHHRHHLERKDSSSFVNFISCLFFLCYWDLKILQTSSSSSFRIGNENIITSIRILYILGVTILWKCFWKNYFHKVFFNHQMILSFCSIFQQVCIFSLFSNDFFYLLNFHFSLIDWFDIHSK